MTHVQVLDSLSAFADLESREIDIFMLQNPSQTGIFVHLFSETVIIVHFLEIIVQFLGQLEEMKGEEKEADA